MSRKHHPEFSDLSPKRWDYLKQNLAAKNSVQRYAHVSCAVSMIPVDVGGIVQHRPWIERPGHTYRRPQAA
jgi:hypothetical protein